MKGFHPILLPIIVNLLHLLSGGQAYDVSQLSEYHYNTPLIWEVTDDGADIYPYDVTVDSVSDVLPAGAVLPAPQIAPAPAIVPLPVFEQLKKLKDKGTVNAEARQAITEGLLSAHQLSSAKKLPITKAPPCKPVTKALAPVSENKSSPSVASPSPSIDSTSEGSSSSLLTSFSKETPTPKDSKDSLKCNFIQLQSEYNDSFSDLSPKNLEAILRCRNTSSVKSLGENDETKESKSNSAILYIAPGRDQSGYVHLTSDNENLELVPSENIKKPKWLFKKKKGSRKEKKPTLNKHFNQSKPSNFFQMKNRLTEENKWKLSNFKSSLLKPFTQQHGHKTKNEHLRYFKARSKSPTKHHEQRKKENTNFKDLSKSPSQHKNKYHLQNIETYSKSSSKHHEYSNTFKHRNDQSIQSHAFHGKTFKNMKQKKRIQIFNAFNWPNDVNTQKLHHNYNTKRDLKTIQRATRQVLISPQPQLSPFLLSDPRSQFLPQAPQAQFIAQPSQSQLISQLPVMRTVIPSNQQFLGQYPIAYPGTFSSQALTGQNAQYIVPPPTFVNNVSPVFSANGVPLGTVYPMGGDQFSPMPMEGAQAPSPYRRTVQYVQMLVPVYKQTTPKDTVPITGISNSVGLMTSTPVRKANPVIEEASSKKSIMASQIQEKAQQSIGTYSSIVEKRKKIDELANSLGSSAIMHLSFNDQQELAEMSRDESGNSNDARFKNGAHLSKSSFGNCGHGVTINKGDVLFPDALKNKPKTAITMSMWVKTQHSGYVRWWDTSANTKDKSFFAATDQASVPKNVWTHLCGTFDSVTGLGRIYVDGTLKKEVHSNTGGVLPDSFIAGGIGRSFGNIHLQYLDEVYMFNRAITEDEVEALYDRCHFHRMVLHYGFQKVNQSLRLLEDQSGLNNSATLTSDARILESGCDKCGFCADLSSGDSPELILDAVKFNKKPKLGVSLSLWVSLNSTEGPHPIFRALNPVAGNELYKLEVVDGKVHWRHVNDEDNQVFNLWTDRMVIPEAIWTNIIVNYDSSLGQAKIYTNGILKAVSDNPSKFILGENWGSALIGGKGYNGLMDEVFMYNWALNKKQIQSTLKYCADQPKLVHFTVRVPLL